MALSASISQSVCAKSHTHSHLILFLSHTFPVMHYISFLVVAAAAVLVAGNYGHGGYHHKCYPKMTVKHHTVHVPVPYTVS